MRRLTTEELEELRRLGWKNSGVIRPKSLWSAKSDPEFEKRLRDNPESVLREFGLPTDPDVATEVSPPATILQRRDPRRLARVPAIAQQFQKL